MALQDFPSFHHLRPCKNPSRMALAPPSFFHLNELEGERQRLTMVVLLTCHRFISVSHLRPPCVRVAGRPSRRLAPTPEPIRRPVTVELHQLRPRPARFHRCEIAPEKKKHWETNPRSKTHSVPLTCLRHLRKLYALFLGLFYFSERASWGLCAITQLQATAAAAARVVATPSTSRRWLSGSASAATPRPATARASCGPPSLLSCKRPPRQRPLRRQRQCQRQRPLRLERQRLRPLRLERQRLRPRRRRRLRRVSRVSSK